MATFWNRINTVLLLLVLLVVIGALASRAWGGPLDPPGPPASTLPQVEPRIPIDHVPFTISTPGSYFLIKNVSGPANTTGNGITINSDDVTLDLNGFSVTGTLADSSLAHGFGINVSLNPAHNIVIRNGVVRDWNYGVAADHMADSQVEGIRVYNSKHDGIRAGSDTTISNCTASLSGDNGIVSFGGVVRSCVADANTTGICLCADNGAAIDNTVTLPTTSATGISVQNIISTVSNNVIDGGSLTNSEVGIDVTGHGSSIHDNILDFNLTGAGSGGVILRLSSGSNQVFHNDFCVAPQVTDLGGNHVAPLVIVDTSLNPWGNASC